MDEVYEEYALGITRICFAMPGAVYPFLEETETTIEKVCKADLFDATSAL